MLVSVAGIAIAYRPGSGEREVFVDVQIGFAETALVGEATVLVDLIIKV
jgi:hypothetical protein